MSSPRLVIVGDHAGQRLDNFLLGHLKGVPKSRIYRMIRKGEVRVNGSRTRPNARLAASDQVRVPPVRTGSPRAREAVPQVLIERLRNAVLFESDDLLVLNKPTGVAVHGGTGHAIGVAEALESAFETDNLQLLHRLDKETSGCLAIAKNRSTMMTYHGLFRNNEIQKTYVAIVENQWPQELDVVNARLERFRLENGERRVRVEDSGRRSQTRFKVARQSTRATWMVVHPQTGRTHQIRVHAAHEGHPVLGDRKYGNRQFKPSPPRLLLHAHQLEIPEVGVIDAGIPDVFMTYWDRLS